MLAEAAANPWSVLGIVASGVFSIASVIVTAKVAKRLGKPNGKGNVVEMNEKQLIMLGKLEERLDSHIANHAIHGDVHGEGAERSPYPAARH